MSTKKLALIGCSILLSLFRKQLLRITTLPPRILIVGGIGITVVVRRLYKQGRFSEEGIIEKVAEVMEKKEQGKVTKEK